ncbi:AAA family ATPase [Mycobacterium sp. DL592]|uniref:AAA family ATPase n=1 Tax=Mycobacterium sp. DL592 TaxID=2675524 RepID=UPI00141ED2D2|nr:AAA family ATPase [Mycobacterium sp. DL592]
MTTVWTGPFKAFEYWADLAENEPDFLIDGMLHSATNTVSGKPTVGKTRLVAAMAAAIAMEEEEFCGSEIVGAGPVMIISTDAGETRRWGLRMREHGVPDGRVGIAKFNPLDWRIYEGQARGARLLVLDNLTGCLGSRKIGDDDAAREICTPLAEIAENGTTVLMIAHSAKNFEAQSGRYTPTGAMGSTVYQAWERLNLHIHDVTEPNTRAVAIRSNDHGNRDLLLKADWGRSSAQWSLLNEKDDTRQRSEEAHQRRNELFDRVADDAGLRAIESARGVGRALVDRYPGEWATGEAAYKAFSRARRSAGGIFAGGRWQRPED